MIAKIEKRKAYTSGQAAKILGVAPRTLTKMCDSGVLESYRLPGSTDRRIEPEALAKLMQDIGIKRAIPGAAPARRPALDATPASPPKILFVGFTPEARGSLLIDGVVPMFSRPGPFAGIAMVGFAPDVVVVDAAMGRIESRMTAEAARSRGAGCVVLGGDPPGPGELIEWAADAGGLGRAIAELTEGD